ncbi:MAG: SH3 domain-containing protein [Candidatus Omnitrophica bacterium]|nr:SH3 domain-containing protein [Candidatus Omnitrophota bacterium]
MYLINKLFSIVMLVVYILSFNLCFATEDSVFKGRISADNINVRTDSTVNAESICRINRGEIVEVIMELYDWYKIKLPKNAPSFIRKDMVSLIDDKTAKVIKTKVNVRLHPSESSAS